MNRTLQRLCIGALVLPLLVACTAAQDSGDDDPANLGADTGQTGQVAEGLTAGCSVLRQAFGPSNCTASSCWSTGQFTMTLACTQADCATVINQAAPRFGLTSGQLLRFRKGTSTYLCMGQYTY